MIFSLELVLHAQDTGFTPAVFRQKRAYCPNCGNPHLYLFVDCESCIAEHEAENEAYRNMCQCCGDIGIIDCGEPCPLCQ